MFATSIARHRALPTTEFTKYDLPPSELTTLSSMLQGFAETIHKVTQKFQRGP